MARVSVEKIIRAAVFGTGMALLVTCGAAASEVECGGAAMMGGAQLACSYVSAKAGTQSCTFSWALMTEANETRVVGGSFLIPPHTQNVQVYQGGGFNAALSPPIVLCHAAGNK